MRTIIDLPEAQLEALDGICRREGISRAEAIRRAIAQHVGQASAADANRAFGLWRARRVDGLAYQRRLRREWETPAPRLARPSARSGQAPGLARPSARSGQAPRLARPDARSGQTQRKRR